MNNKLLNSSTGFVMTCIDCAARFTASVLPAPRCLRCARLDLRKRAVACIHDLLALRREHDAGCPLMANPYPTGPCKCPVGRVGTKAIELLAELEKR